MQVTILEADDYHALDAETLQRLDDHAAQINLRVALTFELMRQIGERLERVKAEIQQAAQDGHQPEKMFMRWCKDNIEVSYATLENWRNVYKHLPPLSPEVAQYISRTAAMKLAQPGASAEGVQAALALAENGTDITPRTAWILSRGAPYIREAFTSGALPEETAYDLTRKIISRSTPDPVREVCHQYQPQSPEVVVYLTDAYKRHEDSKRTGRPSRTWESIIEDGVLNGIGWSVSIADARPIDAERHRADAQQMYIQEHGERFDWLGVTGTAIECEDGTVHLVLSGRDADRLRQHTGQPLYQKVRVPRDTL